MCVCVVEIRRLFQCWGGAIREYGTRGRGGKQDGEAEQDTESGYCHVFLAYVMCSAILHYIHMCPCRYPSLSLSLSIPL